MGKGSTVKEKNRFFYQLFVYIFLGLVAVAGWQIAAAQEGSVVTHHVHVSGQSLALGTGGTPVLTDTPSVNQKMYKGGEWQLHWGGFESLKPIYTETISSGMAETVTNLIEQDGLGKKHNMLMSLAARGGTSIEALDLAGGDTYGIFYQGITSFWVAKLLYDQADMPYSPSSLIWLQGTTDVLKNMPELEYRYRLWKLQKDYERYVNWATGNQKKLPLFTFQENVISAWGLISDGVPMAQLKSGEDDEDIYLVSPIYPFQYSDRYHLTNHGYRHLGAYFGKAYKKVVVDGEPWRPLVPTRASQEGRRIVVEYHVPAPPLVLDTVQVSNPGDYGFSLYDQLGRIEISRVEVVDEDTVVILAARDASEGVEVRYGYQGAPIEEYWYASKGGFEGARGNLRDSDPAVGFGLNESGLPYHLYNWSVVFRMPVESVREGSQAMGEDFQS